MTIELRKDQHGNVITSPVMGWATLPVAGIAVLLAIEYATTPEEIEIGGKQVQLALTPHECLSLAEGLTKVARQVLEDESSSGTPLN
jgi:hypothetical protein